MEKDLKSDNKAKKRALEKIKALEKDEEKLRKFDARIAALKRD